MIERVTVKEVSPVLRGSGVGTRTLAVKRIDVLDPQTAREVAQIAETFRRGQLDRELRDIKANLDVRCVWDSFRTSHRYALTQPPDADTAKAADALCRYVAGALGIDPPPLHWIKALSAGAVPFALGTSQAVLGAQRADGIFARADAGMSFAETMSIVAHEVRHAAGGDEDEAASYEQQWHDRLAVR
ncbi:MAG: hypothetical protein H0V23_14080 [Nocardioidaceae bacterium]|nr:hypothetical protein [Nocardioidaceae bacterium]